MQSSSPVTIYEPNYRGKHGFFKTWKIMASNIWKSRFLIQQLFIRDFFAIYKKSFLGITWILISPLIGIVSWVFLQKAGMLNPGELDIPYPAYVLMGTLAWDFFVGTLKASSNTLKAGKSLVMQVNYPHEALMVKEIAQFLSNYLLRFLLVLIVLMLFGVFPSWKIIFLPLVLLPSLLLGSGIGLVMSLFDVISGDVRKIVNMGLKLLMWSTPIVYGGKNLNPVVQMINDHNPLTFMVCSIRDIVLYGRIYGDLEFYYCSIVALVVFLIAWRLFYVSEQQLVERMI